MPALAALRGGPAVASRYARCPAVDASRDGLAGREAGYRLALSAAEKEKGPEAAETLRAATNLGLVLHNLGRFQESEELLRRTLTGRTKVFGSMHEGTFMAVYGAQHEEYKYS